METPEHHGNILKFRWLGSDNMYLDEPTIQTCRDVIVGCYGGNSDAGAVKNEDGALVWCAENGAWKFAVLLDAHNSIQSAKLVLDTHLSLIFLKLFEIAKYTTYSTIE